MVVEIDVMVSDLEGARQQALQSGSRADGLEGQLARLRVQVDELTKQLADANNHKNRLTQENFELQKTLQDMESGHSSLSKIKVTLTSQLDEAKRAAEDESRVSSLLLSAFSLQ